VLGLEDHSRNITSVALLERYAGLVMESVEAHADTLVGRLHFDTTPLILVNSR